MTVMTGSFSGTAGFGPLAEQIGDSLKSLSACVRESQYINGARMRAEQELQDQFLDCIQPDWDGHGALPVSSNSYESARQFLDALPQDICMPAFSAEPDGCLTAEWYKKPDVIVSISFPADGGIEYAAMFGKSMVRHGREPFSANVSGGLLEMIRKVQSFG